MGIADVAAHLRVARDSIYRWVETKDFPAHRVGRLLRFRLSEVDEWVRTSGDGDSGNHSTTKATRAMRKWRRELECLRSAHSTWRP